MKKSAKRPVSKRADFSDPIRLPFVGREKLCEEVGGRLAAGGCVFLCGMQQVGKTRVAKRVMKDLSESKGTVCVYVSLSDLATGAGPLTEQLCSLILYELTANAGLEKSCRKAHIDLMPPRIVPPVFRSILRRIHECLGLKVVLFVDEVTKYLTWGENVAADLLNMLQELVENGHETGLSVCMVSQLSLEMIRLRTPANRGGLHARLSANEFFVPPFSRKEIDELCSLSSVTAEKSRNLLYDKTRGYIHIAHPVIAEFDRRAGSPKGDLSEAEIMKAVISDCAQTVSESIAEICENYHEHGFDPNQPESMRNSLLEDYSRMGLISEKSFAFAGSYTLQSDNANSGESTCQDGDLKLVLDVSTGILQVGGERLVCSPKINAKELSLLCMVAPGKSPADCLEQLVDLRKWYDNLPDKDKTVPKWVGRFDEHNNDGGHKKFSKLEMDDLTRLLSSLRVKHKIFKEIFPPRGIKQPVPRDCIDLQNFNEVDANLSRILGFEERVS